MSQRSELPAERFTAEVSVVASQSGRTRTFAGAGTVDVQFTRQFRDGSLGRLVVASLPWVSGGGFWVELRTFSDGRLLDIANLSPWAGERGSIELFDDLWAAVNPLVRGRDPQIATRWPQPLLGTVGAATTGAWNDDGYDVAWSGETTGTRSVRLSKQAMAVRSQQAITREGETLVWTSEVTLTRVGPVAPVALNMPWAVDDPALDAMPLTLASPVFGFQTSTGRKRDSAVRPYVLAARDSLGP